MFQINLLNKELINTWDFLKQLNLLYNFNYNDKKEKYWFPKANLQITKSNDCNCDFSPQLQILYIYIYIYIVLWDIGFSLCYSISWQICLFKNDKFSQ